MMMQVSQSMKIVLGLVLAVFLGGAILVLSAMKPVAQDNQVAMPKEETQAPEGMDAPVPVSQPAPIESQNKLKELQDQLNAGKITPEEAMQQMNDFNNAKAE